ncbi:MAG: HAMP domain-containing histidine kinase [Saprospiraceae bacterium]|nr:HAMP domain-containing histidine kinase [Saprospiraceae bacterium]
MKNDFIQNMTHELKTPVATMSIALEAIQNFKASENETMKSEYIQIARNEINKLDNLVDKVLSFIQISEHPTLEEISINAFMNEVENSFNLRANQHNIYLKIQAIEKDIHYYGDKHNLKTVVFNLVDNALKYNQKQSGIVEISAQENHSFLTITVFDNGKQIPKDLAKSIFEKFYRVSKGNLHNVKGHGLGLYIVKMIVEKMNGSISLVSNELGNYFIVKLPIK